MDDYFINTEVVLVEIKEKIRTEEEDDRIASEGRE